MSGLEGIAALTGAAVFALGATVMVVGIFQMVTRRVQPAHRGAISTFMAGSGVAFVGSAILIGAVSIDNLGWVGLAVALIVALLGIRQLVTASVMRRQK
ncbi:MAG: hypothetical protein WEE67_04235 [Chloroflexota bacterium]